MTRQRRPTPRTMAQDAEAIRQLKEASRGLGLAQPDDGTRPAPTGTTRIRDPWWVRLRAWLRSRF